MAQLFLPHVFGRGDGFLKAEIANLSKPKAEISPMRQRIAIAEIRGMLFRHIKVIDELSKSLQQQI
jgi:hypothetical protein